MIEKIWLPTNTRDSHRDALEIANDIGERIIPTNSDERMQMIWHE